MTQRIALALLLALWTGITHGQPVEMRGTIDSVIVYRGQAMVTRIIDLPQPAGWSELVVGALPERVIPGSLFAEAGAGVEVRSVLYRTRALEADVREEVRKLDQQIEATASEIEAVTRGIAVIRQNQEYLARLEQFTAATANVELTRGVLNAETLQKLSTFVFDQRDALNKRALESESQLSGARKRLDLQTRQRAELTSGASKTAREAVLLAESKAGGGQVRLSYLVDGAGWTPSYVIHASSGKPEISMLYQAAISQMSGEDWSNVTMTLSTATPSVVSRAPTLEPLVLSLRRIEQAAAQQAQRADADYLRELQMRKSEAVYNWNNFRANDSLGQGASPATPPLSMTMASNLAQARKAVDDIQTYELTAPDEQLARQANRTEEAITVTYLLLGRTTLPSRADQQLVSIAQLQMKSDPYKIAVPVLTSYVYNEAIVTNGTQTVLLAGPCVSYLDGQFVGHGQVPTVAIGGRFTAGFGIDPSLRATRELVERTEQTQGANSVVTFDYRLAIENFSDKPTRVRLMDRMPKADGNQIKPTLVSTSAKLSDDGEYERTERKQGLLRWDVDVAARAANGAAVSIDYRLTLEHDKQMKIAGR